MTYRYTFISTRPRRYALVGSRHLVDYREFACVIRPHLRPTDILISGAADGIDSLAARYARQNHHQMIEHPVDLSRVRELELEGKPRNVAYGIAAGERNQLIVNDADRMIAIACPHSKGTYDSIRRMRKKLEAMTLDSRVDAMRILFYIWACNAK